MRIAVITGATSGIGYEAALEADSRFKSLDEIWVIGRNTTKLEELSEHITHSVRTFSMDLTSEEDLKNFENILAGTKPEIKLLFQSAGCGLHGKFERMKRKDETDIIRLNCEALTAMTSICLPYMHAKSHIILVSSAAAFCPFPGYSVYSASKSYVLNFARSLRAELRKRKIVVTAVCPGPVNTPFFSISERYTNGVSIQKRKLMASPRKVARKALFDAYLHRMVSVNSPLVGLFRIIAKLMPHGILVNLVKLLG